MVEYDDKGKIGKILEIIKPTSIWHFVVLFSLFAVVILAIMGTLDFFHFFNCDRLESYMAGDLQMYKPHAELTDAEHIRLHTNYENKCL